MILFFVEDKKPYFLVPYISGRGKELKIPTRKKTAEETDIECAAKSVPRSIKIKDQNIYVREQLEREKQLKITLDFENSKTTYFLRRIPTDITKKPDVKKYVFIDIENEFARSLLQENELKILEQANKEILGIEKNENI